MKHMKFLLALLLAALMIVPVMIACTRADRPAETTAPVTETEPAGTTAPVIPVTTAPAPFDDSPKTDKTSFTVKSGDAEMSFEVKNGTEVYITSLKTKKSGKNVMQSNSKLSLPTKYGASEYDAKFTWTFDHYRNYRDDLGGTGYILTFHEEHKTGKVDITYDLYVISREAYGGPFEIKGYLYNNSGAKIDVFPNDFFTADVKIEGGKAPTAWTFRKESGMAEGWTIYSGQTYGGTGIYKKTMTKGKVATAYDSTNQDWNAGGDIPMMYLDYGGKSGVYFAVEWTNCTLQAKSVDGDGDVKLNTFLADGGFSTKVPDGGSFYLPSVYFGVYDGDIDDGSNVFKRWFFNCKMPDCMRDDPNEPLTQQDMQIGYDVNRLYGIQSIKWDYGWWSNTAAGAWKTNEGLLEVHNPAYISSIGGKSTGDNLDALANFVKRANKAGVKLAMYILLKDTGLNRDDVPSAIKHPNWFSNRVVTVGRSADLGNEDCVKFFQQYMLNFFRKTGVTTWRSDFEPISRDSNLNNRHKAGGKDVQYWCTVGFGELVDYLDENLDNFRYESCCSGGAMKDFFTMTKAAVINCDDSADYMSLHMSFYDSSYCMHPAQLQLPCNALTYTQGSKNYSGTADYLYGLRCVITGGVMLSNWEGTAAQDRMAWPLNIKDIYNTKLKPLIRDGDLYHILPRPDGKRWDGIEYIDLDSPNNIKGAVMLWKPTNQEGSSKVIKLRGLDPDQMYRLSFQDRTEQDVTMFGDDLMTDGITVKISEKVGSEIIWISVVK